MLYLFRKMQDKELAELLILKDENAFNIFYEKYSSFIYKICLFSLKNENEALEAMQDVFFKILKKIGSYKFRGDLKSWIGAIAYNEAKNRKRNILKEIKKIFAFKENKKEVENPEKISIKFERNKILKEAVFSLPYKFRIIIFLREIEGESYENISKILKINEGTVKSRLARARIFLRKILKEKGIERL